MQSIAKLTKACLEALLLPEGAACTLAIKASEERAVGSPGLRLPMRAEMFTSIEMCAASLPASLKDKPLRKDKCWSCLRCNVATQMCEGCHLARFCSLECRSHAWQEHKALCQSLQGSFSREHHKRFDKIVEDLYQRKSRRTTYAQAVRAIAFNDFLETYEKVSSSSMFLESSALYLSPECLSSSSTFLEASGDL